MKILLASDCYIYQTGGITTVVVALAEGLKARGHDVRVLAPSYNMKSFKEGYNYYLHSIPAFYYKGLRTVFDLGDPLMKELIEWGPDIIHLHSEGGVSRRADRIRKKLPFRVPVVVTAHINFPYYVFGRMSRFAPVALASNLIGRQLYRRADHIIMPSEKPKTFPYFHSFPKPITVIYNGLDLERWKGTITPEERRALFEKYGLKDNGYTMITVSRLAKEKNIQEILGYLPSLLEQQPDIQYVIVGDGPYRKKLEKISQKLGLSDHVHFTGMVTGDQVPSYLGMGDVFVSASEFEVHSIAYLEAMARGVPMVLREDDSIIGVLDHGKNGFVYRTKEEFCDYVLQVLRDKGLQESMRKEALSRIDEFSFEKNVDKTLELYEEILKQN